MACWGSVALSLASSVASMACWGRTRVAHGRAKQGRTPQANSGGVARGEARLRRRVRRRDLRRERRHRLAGLAAREGLVRGPPRLQRVQDVRLQRVPRRVRVGPRAAHEHRDAVGAGRRAGREGGEQHSHASTPTPPLGRGRGESSVQKPGQPVPRTRWIVMLPRRPSVTHCCWFTRRVASRSWQLAAVRH